MDMKKSKFVELSKEEYVAWNGGTSQGSLVENVWNAIKGWLFGK